MPSLNESLQTYREQINGIDDQLAELVNQRARISLNIGKVKKAYDPSQKNIRDHQRELAIIQRINTHNSGPLSDRQLASLFELIFQLHRELQQEASYD